MTHSNDVPGPDSTDYKIALVVGVCALAAYVRTLAPDVLYGDSAEFQTLAYTLGTTHSTGYPVYLLLARLLGFLPIGSPAMFEHFVMPDLVACCEHLDLLLSIPRLRGIQWIPGDGQPPPEEWLPLLKRIRDGGKLCQVFVGPEGARHIVKNLGGVSCW